MTDWFFCHSHFYTVLISDLVSALCSHRKHSEVRNGFNYIFTPCSAWEHLKDVSLSSPWWAFYLQDHLWGFLDLFEWVTLASLRMCSFESPRVENNKCFIFFNEMSHLKRTRDLRCVVLFFSSLKVQMLKMHRPITVMWFMCSCGLFWSALEQRSFLLPAGCNSVFEDDLCHRPASLWTSLTVI